jgi:hypothetical protein
MPPIPRGIPAIVHGLTDNAAAEHTAATSAAAQAQRPLAVDEGLPMTDDATAAMDATDGDTEPVPTPGATPAQ